MKTPVRKSVGTSFAIAIALLTVGIDSYFGPAFAEAADSWEHLKKLPGDEATLWYVADRIDETARRSDTFIDDPELGAYLQRVVDQLFSDVPGQLKVRLYRGTAPEAFALANGSIYISPGILAYMDNEAQLAAILGHEGSHFIYRHGVERGKSAMQTIRDVISYGDIRGVPDPGGSRAFASLMTYSRRHERASDEAAFERMQSAGYDVREAIVFLNRLEDLVETLGSEDREVPSSHPAMAERIGRYMKMAKKTQPGGKIGVEPFETHGGNIARYYLADLLQQGNHRAIKFFLEEDGRLEKLPPENRFYLGEAYRLRGMPSDLELAVEHYRRTIEDVPAFAPAYSSLGKVLMKLDENEEAAGSFRRYQSLLPDAPDGRYVESYLAQLETGQ